MMNETKATTDALFTISAVAEKTGVNPVTLRAWERRYGVIRPARTEKGRRLYSQNEVEKIKTLLGLIDQGISISRAADAMKGNEKVVNETESVTDAWQPYISRMYTAVSLFDEKLLDDAYTEATSIYPIDVVTQRLLLPLLEMLGDRWNRHSTGIAEEHFFSVFMRNKLGARFHHQNRFAQGAPVIAAGLPGEQHEFGMLLFTLTLLNHGYRIVLLGPDLPLNQLHDVVRKTNARAVVLSGSVDAPLQNLLNPLSDLKSSLGVPIFLGGSVTQENEASLKDIGVIPVGKDIRLGVDRIHETLVS